MRMCILDLSKVLMCEFHYDYIKNKDGKNTRLLFPDTENLMYEIKTGYALEDFSKDKEIFDFSNYSTGSKYYDDSNKLVERKMKDKIGGGAIKELVRLKPKMYSLLVDHNSEHKKQTV